MNKDTLIWTNDEQMSVERLLFKLQFDVLDCAEELDHLRDDLHYPSIYVGWATANGLTPQEAVDFANFVDAYDWLGEK